MRADENRIPGSRGEGETSAFSLILYLRQKKVSGGGTNSRETINPAPSRRRMRRRLNNQPPGRLVIFDCKTCSPAIPARGLQGPTHCDRLPGCRYRCQYCRIKRQGVVFRIRQILIQDRGSRLRFWARKNRLVKDTEGNCLCIHEDLM